MKTCFILCELPLDNVYVRGEALTERVYLANGEQFAERLFSSLGRGDFFWGRDAGEVWFKRGDKVEEHVDLLRV